VRRLEVGHAAGRFRMPRARFLWQAGGAAFRAHSAGAAILTRDLQLADLLLRWKPGLRLVYEAHALEALMYRERGRLYGTGERPDERKARRIAAREGRVFRSAAAVVATTAGIRDDLAGLYGPRPHTRVIANGCDLTAGGFQARPPQDPPRVLYAGQLYPWKGVDTLVEALARLPGVRLRILGGLPGENDTTRVSERVAALGLGSRVELLGTLPQAQVAAELQQADAVAVPFLHTGMTERHTSPLKLFEALAAGRAIVASDLPSSREVLSHEQNALLVPPGDPGALADALGRLLYEPGLAARLAQNAFLSAARYSWDARAAALASLIEELT